MNQPYIFMMLGFPGSGKSFVAAWLKDKHSAVYLRSDDLRLAMFGEDRLELHRNPHLRTQLYGAMDYATKQVLDAGSSVIYDANLNFRRSRNKLRQFARERGAQAVVVWIKTPLTVAKERAEQREAAGGQKIFEPNLGFIDRMARNLEPPTSNELVIELDGTMPAAAQQAAFVEQLTQIETRHD